MMLEALQEAVRCYTDRRLEEDPSIDRDSTPTSTPFSTGIDGVTILRSNRVRRPNHLLYRPALCIVVQGEKWTTFGDRQCECRAGQAIVVCVETPASGRVVEASPTEPYLGLIVEFDLAMMREVFEGLTQPPQQSIDDAGSGAFVVDLDGPVLSCLLRMVHLLGTPEAIPIVSPLIMREICYWLLTGPNGANIVDVAMASRHAQAIVDAIHVLRDRFRQPLRIGDLADVAHMSPSAFHRQFKALTSMTPLQYQKQLRLIEARRLMVSDAANVETAAFQVGYESPSQFSREYARMFGAPPRRDVAALKTA